jgi:hypothetical protein
VVTARHFALSISRTSSSTVSLQVGSKPLVGLLDDTIATGRCRWHDLTITIL